MASHSTQPKSPDTQRTVPPRRRSIFWFAATILLGAFLVFQVQPVISKCVLPWFGGTPAVWTTCMLFFQVLLFAGYLYAHALKTWCRPSVQGVIHLTLLSAAAFALPIQPGDAWKPIGNEVPIVHLLGMLFVHVGLPYFVLASTGPLVQAWFSYEDQSDRIYRLYALSNVGSLVALLSYPFIVEPMLPVAKQSTVWSLLFCGFVLVQGVLAIGLLRKRAVESGERKSDELTSLARPGHTQLVAWIGLPALASTLLLVITNHVCQDIAVIPFLWILPLTLYLISFIICFDSPQWYKPKWIAAGTLLAITAIQTHTLLPGSIQLVVEASCYMLLLLGVCLLCHGEVARIKPPAQFLTTFYACLSGGGAIGGILVAIVCPLVFTNHAELPLTLSLSTALAFILFFVCQGWRQSTYDWSAAERLRFGAIAVMVLPFVAVAVAPRNETLDSQRNFFGVLKVTRDDHGVRLVHGSTIHGIQRPGDFSGEPTSYYGRESGVGRVIAAKQTLQPRLRLGVIGLGCGVLAAYGREADHFDMVEINPAVVELADRHFTFLSDSRASIQTHLGDGRLVMERMTDARFDVLVLDAFSSDAIPAHLLTTEAMSLYKSRLAEDGVIAIHVSNNHLDLVPLTCRLGRDAKLDCRIVSSVGDIDQATKPANWVVITQPGNPIVDSAELKDAEVPNDAMMRSAPRWTDQHHDLVSVLKLW
ncbi:MAG: fused MFS/spermidine synthase [Planctomycetota bacterium]